jgi:hypothetical protein
LNLGLLLHYGYARSKGANLRIEVGKTSSSTI